MIILQIPLQSTSEFHIQWRMVVIVAGCALFVTSHKDVKFMFPIHRFGEVC